MRARIAGGVVAAALLLAGCAGAEPVIPVEDAASGANDPAAAAQTLVTLLSEIDRHFWQPIEPADADTTTSIISPGATVDVAVVELTEALDLGQGARDFAAATASEVARTAAQSLAVTDVVVDAGEPEVVGSHDGLDVVTVAITESVTHDDGVTAEASTTYALTIDGDRLADVGAWLPGLDSGVSLSSPTGAAQRYADLVRAGDVDAARYFSADVNTEAEIGVLATTLATADVTFVEVPQQRLGSAHVVYGVDRDSRLVGRFEVLLGSTTQVVYSPTS